MLAPAAIARSTGWPTVRVSCADALAAQNRSTVNAAADRAMRFPPRVDPMIAEVRLQCALSRV